MELKGSSCSLDPTTGHYPGSDKYSPHSDTVYTSPIPISLQLMPTSGLPCDIFTYSYLTKITYAFLISPIHATHSIIINVNI